MDWARVQGHDNRVRGRLRCGECGSGRRGDRPRSIIAALCSRERPVSIPKMLRRPLHSVAGWRRRGHYRKRDRCHFRFHAASVFKFRKFASSLSD